MATTENRPFVPGRVTVITATYNVAMMLERCLASVEGQGYPDIEHLIIDGGSKDATLDILRGSSATRMRWISERDNGIYDAWNKGLNLATGEWIAFLGADDCYLPGAIQAYMDVASTQPADYICSLVRWIPAGEPSKIIGAPWSWPAFQREMRQAHVGSMHHRTLFDRYGNYNTAYRIVGDYELLLRPREKLRALFFPTVTAEMDAGGTSDSFRALTEAERAKIHTGGRPRGLARLELWTKQLKLLARRILTRIRTRQ